MRKTPNKGDSFYVSFFTRPWGGLTLTAGATAYALWTRGGLGDPRGAGPRRLGRSVIPPSGMYR
eukprot:348459-Prymnesium_polylepis.1